MNVYSLLLTFIVGLFILGGSFCSIKYVKNKKFINFNLSLMFGIIISNVLINILPKSLKILSGEIGIVRGIIAFFIVIFIGIVMFKILDLLVPNHEYKNIKSEKVNHNNLHHIGILTIISIILYNLMVGVNLYLISKENLFSGILLSIVIGLYNISTGLFISSTLYNYSKRDTIIFSLCALISVFIGGFIMFILGGINVLFEGVILGIISGMLIYIIVFELFNRIRTIKEKNLLIIGILIGIIISIISIFINL